MLRDRLLEEGLLHEATSAAKKNGVQCKAAISRALFQELYPYAEDANHGVSWEEILYDMFKIFKRNFKDSRSTYGEFGINTKTYVKEIYKTLNEESLPLIFPDGQPRDKRVDVFISWMPDENLEPSLVFGLKSSKFF
jgi:hypothetical protein